MNEMVSVFYHLEPLRQKEENLPAGRQGYTKHFPLFLCPQVTDSPQDLGM